MFITIIFGFFVGFATNQTIQFKDCKAQDFKTPVCKTSKFLEENKAK